MNIKVCTMFLDNLLFCKLKNRNPKFWNVTRNYYFKTKQHMRAHPSHKL